MRRKLNLLALCFVLLLVALGCSKEEIKPKPSPTTLADLYPGDLRQVDRIEIRSGSTGELHIYDDAAAVQKWLTTVSQITLTPDPNQEGRVGFLYGVSLYEKKTMKLGFTNNSIASVYYLHNEAWVREMQAFFDAGKP
ncbi:hypothetical protein ABE504_18345 [Paenibacillus oryzisoli]|uniref:hypothetical protein n=1 Tax=Paenibacillus oryzisoli TaxID=1850517 RepID=UPI003D2E3631